MPAKPNPKDGATASRRPEHDDPAAVAAFLTALNHPLKPVVASIRSTILQADPAITEGIKWNCPSFYRCGWFATVNIRPKVGVLVVLHHGAKIREGDETLSATLEDPDKLLKWLGKDRATVSFLDAGDFVGTQTAFEKVIKQWSAYQALLATQT